MSPSLGPQQGTVIGGGRYDGLAEALGGPSTPGVGFGSGIERLNLAVGPEWDPYLMAPIRRHGRLEFFVIAVGEPAGPAARGLARDLRGERGMRSAAGGPSRRTRL